MPYTTMQSFPLSFGVLSEGTLRPRDLLSAAHDALDAIYCAAKRDAAPLEPGELLTLGELYGRGGELLETCPDFQNDDDGADDIESRCAELADELFTFLSELAPPFVYVGSHEGDGACVLLTVDVDAARDDADACGDDMLDPWDAARDDLGLFLHINDHGNATLYHLDRRPVADGGAPCWVEIWGVV